MFQASYLAYEKLGSNTCYDEIMFFRRFLSNPTEVGAIAPSSRYLAAKMISHIDWCPDIVIVELGPGTGPFTEAISNRIAPESVYIGVETDEAFVAHLNERFDNLTFEHDSAAKLLSLLEKYEVESIDEIVSGLPFASLPSNVSESILEASFAALKPGGSFVTFQYLHSTVLPPAIKFRARMKRLFGPMVGWRFELCNLPPAFVLRWMKG